MKLIKSLLALSGSGYALNKCPLYANKEYVLVRRTTDDFFANGDLMAGTMVFGAESSNRLADSFAIDHTGMGWDEALFMTGDCSKWAIVSYVEFLGWGREGPNGRKMRILGSSENPEIHDILVQNGVMTTSDFNAADGCNIVYSEDGTAPACATNTDGQSNSAEFNGYNVYIRYMGEKLYPHDINPFAPAPYQFSVTATDDSYKSVEYTDAIQNFQCWEDSWMSQDQARMWCDAYTGPSGTDPPGSWVPISFRSAEDYQAFTTNPARKCKDFNDLDSGIDGDDDYIGQRTWYGLTDDQDGWGGSVGNNCAVRNTVYTDIWGNPTDFPNSGDPAFEWTLDGDGGTDDGQGSTTFTAYKGKEYRQHMDCMGSPGDGNTFNDRKCSGHIKFHACMPKWKGVDGPNGDPTECGAVREPWTAFKLADRIARAAAGGDDIQCFQPCPAGGSVDECDAGSTFEETFTKCAEYTGPDSNDAPGTWVPIAIEKYQDFVDLDTQIIQAGINGCTPGQTMTWMGLNDHMNSCTHGAGMYQDIWGNRVEFENWPDDENLAAQSPNAVSENGCVKCGGSNNVGCRAVHCTMKHNYMCVRKYNKVAGPTNVPGRTCLPIVPRAIDVCQSNLCSSWGDPHVIMFDGDVTDVFGVNKYIYSVPTPYASDTLGVHNFQIATQTKRLGTVSMNKELLFTFSDQTERNTYEFKMAKTEVLMKVNGGIWVKLDQEQGNDAYKFYFSKTEDRKGRTLDTFNVDTWHGIKVYMNGGTHYMELPQYFSGDAQDADGFSKSRVFGLCGNMNCEQGDDRDLRSGKQCRGMEDQYNYSNDEGTTSWKGDPVGRTGKGGRSECEYQVAQSFICPDAPPQKAVPAVAPRACTDEDKQKCTDLLADPGWDACKALLDEKFGVDEEGENMMMNQCKQDVCEAPDDEEFVEGTLNDKLQAFQQICTVEKSQNPKNALVEIDVCTLPTTMTCSEQPNQVFNPCIEDCADYMMTCSEYLDLEPRSCDANKAPRAGCVCDTDHYRDQNGDCVPKDECTEPTGRFTEWSPWGACSKTCGGGDATRSRLCMGGGTCTGPEVETKQNVCGLQKCFEEKVCADLSSNCEGFEEGFVDPETQETQEIVVKVPIPDPGTPVDPQNPPVMTINGVDTTDFDPETQEFVWVDPVTSVTRRFSVMTNMQGIEFTDGQRIQRSDDDECEVQNNVDVCTNYLLHDQLRCTNGDGLSVCNVVAEDDQTHQCKEYLSSTDAGWEDMTNADAKAKCRLEGGRLLRITSLFDIKMLTEAAGSDLLQDPYDMHAICAEDTAEEGTWKSYEASVDAGVWSDGKPDGGETMDCAHLVVEATTDAATDRYRLVDYDCAETKPFICERPRRAQTEADAWSYAKQEACQHWINCLDGALALVDQEQKLDPNGGTPTYTNEMISITQTDSTGVYIGQQQEDIISVAGAGFGGGDWIGKIQKSSPERCIQETLDEYCAKLGMADDQMVPGEDANYEDYNYARWSSTDSKWVCYRSILTGDGVDARSATCIDNHGNTNQLVQCQAPNTGADEIAAAPPVVDDVVHRTMEEIIRHHVEYGCKRPDKIEFTAPHDNWIRCSAGCEPQYQYTRPSRCNLCEETGMTKEYECAFFFDQTVQENIDQVIGTPAVATTWEICTKMCMQNTECESVFWDRTAVAGGGDAMCTMLKASTDTADGGDKTCAHTDVIGGRKCNTDHECTYLTCDYCGEHGYTMREGCTYGANDDMDADSRQLNVLSYSECTAKCTATADCKGVTYYSKYYAGTSINSGVTDELANNGVGPMLCVLKKSLTELTCHNGDEHYQEIVSGEPCLTTNLDYYQSEDYTGQTICVDMCHTCHITEENLLTQSENWTHRSMTTEYNCIHDGTGFIETKQGITAASDCVAECHAMTDAGINICTHTRFITADATVIGNTGPDGNPIAQGDCELYEGALDNTRTCNPDTVGQISSRYCAHEELCHVGCGDLDECAEPGGYNDCAAIAEAGGYADSVTCANTMGSYTCNRGAGSLVPNEAAWSGDDSGGDGLSPWTNNETGDTVTLEAGADGKVTITGLGDAPMEGTIVGNTITVPDPNNPENPLIGTISADGKTIDWTQAGQTAYTMGRSDIDECPPTAATDPCADQAGTVCYNTEPGFSCNCDIHDAQWTFTDGNGAEQTITVTVDTAAQPKAAITYTLGDGSTVTGTLLGSTLEYDDGTGNLKTGTITKNPDGTTTIGWVNQDGSTADTWSRVAGTGNTPAGTNTGTGTTAAPNGATTTPVVTGSGTGQPAGLVTDPTSPVPTTQAGAAATTQAGAAATTQAGAVATTQAGAAVTNAQGVTAAPTTINGAGGGNANGVGNGVTTQAPNGSGTNNGAGATGSVTGDPHFRINFINQKDICFDISGHNGTVFNLLHEPKSGLIINGEVRDVVWKNHRSHRLAKIGVISPEGARVAFSMDAIETYTSSGEVRRFDYNTYAGMIIVEDIMLSTQTLEKFRHKGATFEVGDSTFSISIKDSKHSLKFYVDNERHLETGVDGLLGFTMAQSYTVNNDNVLTINGETMRYIIDEVEDCYRLNGIDVELHLGNHQLGMHNQLLGAPIKAQLIDTFSPK